MKSSQLIIFTTSFFLHAIFASNVAGQDVFNKKEIEALPNDQLPIHSVYLIGDAGEDPDHQSGMMIMAPMIKANPEATVVFLGDNIYPRGLHSKKSWLREQDEERIDVQMDVVKDHPGEAFFIPGNHDWEQGGRNGRDMVKRQQKYVEEYLGDDDYFRPDKGCPGPEVVEIGDDLAIIAIDTQWWIHGNEKSIGEADGCNVIDPAGFMIDFKEALKKNRNKHVVVVGHHPLKSNGEHGGRFTWKEHLFPLLNVKSNLYIPLPGIGSIYPLYRNMLGDRQDIQHPVYGEMAAALLAAMNEYENVVYAAGHEHNLQYFKENNSHLIVSGAGSKVTHVRNSAYLLFGAERTGFARLDYFEDGRVFLQYFCPDGSGGAELLFSEEIYQKSPITLASDATTPDVDYSGMTAIVQGDSTYEAKGLKKFLMGGLNRELWTLDLEVPYLNLHKIKGGLDPIKIGGGMQSKSIRFEGKDGHQYVVRQIKKNTTFLVEKKLRNTLAQAVIYDGIAGSHPFAGVAIGRLSDPLGIYHTNPELVYLPDDPILGDLRDDFGNTFCLFEERPDDDASDIASFGNSKEIVSYSKMIEKVHEKEKHSVDQQFVLRNRLFDMLIGDWDRHDDQWRWASFKEDGLTSYRPIPRDRDQAFFKFNGVIPSIANRKWMLRKFQSFGPEIRDIKGQNFNGRFFDRSWMTELDKSQWIEEVRYIQTHLSDEDIDAAIAIFPEGAQAYNGEFLKRSIKARRDNLDEIAERYYKVLSKQVDVVGKAKSDYFMVERLTDGNVKVSVYSEKGGEPEMDKLHYQRVFDRDETHEIMLYGLDGKDIYHIKGEVKKSIMVRIIGGEENDLIKDESHVKGMRRMTHYYDDVDKNTIEKSKETKVDLRPEDEAIHYNRRAFIYNTFLPVPSIGYNQDDEVLVGAKLSWNTYGFDKDPHKSEQAALFNTTFDNDALNFEYAGRFTEVLGKYDLGLEAKLNLPYFYNFNGFGNETEELDLDSIEVRFNRIIVRPYIALTNQTGASSLRLNLHAEDYRFDDDGNEDGIAAQVLQEKDNFIGGGIQYDYRNMDNAVSPHRGIRFTAAMDYSVATQREDDIDFFRLKSSLSMYFPLGWIPLKSTLALRTGTEHIAGEFNFYQSAFLGGQKEFRGVARNRYAGNTSWYNNAEIRTDLIQVKNYALPFQLGVVGHADLARVWLNNEDSDVWHNSFGGGIYLNFLDFLTLNGTYSVSDNGDSFILQGGFLF